jgi:hypothetical protein
MHNQGPIDRVQIPLKNIFPDPQLNIFSSNRKDKLLQAGCLRLSERVVMCLWQIDKSEKDKNIWKLFGPQSHLPDPRAPAICIGFPPTLVDIVPTLIHRPCSRIPLDISMYVYVYLLLRIWLGRDLEVTQRLLILLQCKIRKEPIPWN